MVSLVVREGEVEVEVEGRRARMRRETTGQLRAAALEEVREHGAVDLSLRRVARRMGMSPAGLYRYVASREDLLTWLIADGFNDLADHLFAALGTSDQLSVPDGGPAVADIADDTADVAARLRAVSKTYRAWSVAHPNQFGLLFGNPIPGYAAPVDGATTAAMTRVGQALGSPLVEAWHQGRLRPVVQQIDDELAQRLAPMAGVATVPVTPELALTLLLTWGRLHGQVSLEVFGHHAWLFPDGCQALFDADVEALLRDLHVVDAP